MLARDDDRSTYSVSELTAAARFLLEERFPMVWVEGELSNLRIPSSGHWYFTLKDDRAQVRCAMFRNRNRFVRFAPDDGMQVVVRGRISLYEPRGDFQLIADHVEPAGEGALRAAFETLKRTLGAEGLFAAERKRDLPRFPRHVAVISSASGAALRDIVSVFRRRAPGLRVTLLPSAVQGPEAEGQLNANLARLADWPTERAGDPPDVVLLARGGGSLEDLSAFNLESVARAIAACPMPVVSAVGHEIDVTIADFVADMRAPTPSAGAELIVPDGAELARALQGVRRRLAGHAQRAVTDAARDLANSVRRLVDPRRALQQRAQRIDDAEQALRRAALRALEAADRDQRELHARLRRVHPGAALDQMRRELVRQRGSLRRTMATRLERASQQTTTLRRALYAVGPLETLGRGYAIVATADGSRWGTPITRVDQVAPGAAVEAHLADGTLRATVDAIIPGADDA